MAISVVASTGLSASQDTISPFAALTYTLPTGTQTNDYLLAVYGGKPYNAEPGAPSEYTSLLSLASGTTANGVDVGSVRLTCFYKIHDGSETSFPSSSFTVGYSPGMRAMLAVRKTEAGAWSAETATGSQEAASTSINVTATTSINFQPGDMLIVATVGRDNDATQTSTSITATGITFGSFTQQLATNTTTTGNDGSMYLYTGTVTSGTATVAPNIQATTGTDEARLAVAFIRLREPSVSILNNATWGFVPI